MADQRKRVNREISGENVRTRAETKEVEGHLPSKEAIASKSKELPSESLFTDSTMYSSDAPNLKHKKAKHEIIRNDLMKVDTTPSQSQMEIAREQELKAAAQKTEMQLTLKTQHKPAINQEQFDKKHGFRRTDLSLARKLFYQIKIMKTWRSLEWMNFLKSRLPIIGWLPAYNWHEDFLRDVVSGIMISIIYIPQGLAYGLMVGIPPIYGIYTGIVGPLIYIFLGTSRHASTGAFAIVAMMVGSVIEQSVTESRLIYNETDRLCCSEITQKPDAEKAIQLSSLIAFFVGVIQVVLGFLHAGLLAVWLSDQLVEGLTAGAAVHVFVSQIQTMTGVRNVPRTSEMFGIIRVIFSIILCYLATETTLDLHLHIIGDIDAGMRAPFLPDFGKTGQIIFSAFSIAIVSFVIHIALAKLTAKEYNYQINVNQEWLALGTMHIVASFFGCFAGGSSLSRTIISAKLGSRSQLTTLVVVIILLIIAFGAAPLFKYLPK
ncbi:unnamed protein product, partial [Onchocerca ochengi]|uniref:Sulfate_transp domain-containing protein n=1 Tax=Onchocerca ochengi TaxID=42157 RepID=A0A182EEM8_ONCOC